MSKWWIWNIFLYLLFYKTYFTTRIFFYHFPTQNKNLEKKNSDMKKKILLIYIFYITKFLIKNKEEKKLSVTIDIFETVFVVFIKLFNHCY